MSDGWRPAGWAPGGPIATIAVADGALIVCGSLAGLAITTDGGRTWRWPSPGRIGPFVADVAAARGTGDGVVVACAPTGLARSRDGGDSWEVLELDAIQVVLLADGRIAAVLRDGELATIDERGASVGHRGSGAPPGISSLALADRDGGVWALAEGRMFRADRLEGPWTEADLPFQLDPVDLAATSAGALLAVGADGSLHRRDPSTGAWSVTPGSDEVALVRAATAAPAAVALLPDAVLVSGDDGIDWHRVSIDGSPVSAGLAPHGSLGVIGLADGRVLAVDLPERSVRVLTSPPSGLVTSLAVEGDRLVVAGFLGAAVSVDGVDWQPIAPPPPAGEATPLAGDGSGRVLIAGGDGIVDVDGAPVATIPTDAIVALASDKAAGWLAVTDGTSIWTMGTAREGRTGQADGWVMTPVVAEERVVALAFGSPGSVEHASLVAATVDLAGDGTIRLLRASHWHSLASGMAGGGGVRLATLPGGRGVYAAIGDTLLRPATVGELVLAPEWPAGRGEPIHALAIARRESGEVVTVLGRRCVFVSHDGGYVWRSLEVPPGPPATAMSLRERESLEIVIARLGGELLASALD